MLERAKRVFDDAIFERVKTDDDQPRAGPQAPDGCFDEPIEPVKLAVDPDAQRLERARRRIDARVATARDRPTNDGCETGGRIDRPLDAADFARLMVP